MPNFHSSHFGPPKKQTLEHCVITKCVYSNYISALFFQTMYAIVEFTGEGSTAIIAQRWFVNEEEDACYWPPKKAAELAHKQAPVSPTWSQHDVRVLGKAGE